MYQTEHDDLFESIRNGSAMNQGVDMAHSTLAAIMTRMSAYTGKVVTWDQALNSQLELTPAQWVGGPGVDASVPVPGKTKLI
jgi:hypothetical protein